MYEIIIIDPFNYVHKQVGIELIPMTIDDIKRSLVQKTGYGFDESEGHISGVWRVKWKRKIPGNSNNKP